MVHNQYRNGVLNYDGVCAHLNRRTPLNYDLHPKRNQPISQL